MNVKKILLTFEKTSGYSIGSDINISLILKDGNTVKFYIGPIIRKKKMIEFKRITRTIPMFIHKYLLLLS